MDKYDGYEDNQDINEWEPWQNPPDPELKRDLDFEEIAYLNTLDEEDDSAPRFNFYWLLIAISVLTLLLFQFFVYYDTIINFLYLQKIQFSHIAGQYQDNQMLVEAREAVVIIKGDTSRGSGFNISKDGLIITNRHVVENQNALSVYFPDGKFYIVNNWDITYKSDLAVLKIKGDGLPFFTLSADNFSEDDKVYCIGSPGSNWWKIAEGEVKAYFESGNILSIIMDAPMGKGASGSPIFNDQGEVGAVLFAENKNYSSEIYAIPVETLRRFLTDNGYL